MEIINKIFDLYKKLYMFGADKGFRFAYWLKKVLSKVDLVFNLGFDLISIAMNIIFIIYWYLILKDKFLVFIIMLLIHIHTILVLVFVYWNRIMAITKKD